MAKRAAYWGVGHSGVMGEMTPNEMAAAAAASAGRAAAAASAAAGAAGQAAEKASAAAAAEASYQAAIPASVGYRPPFPVGRVVLYVGAGALVVLLLRRARR